MIINCPRCAAENRVEDYSLGEIALCGGCNAALPSGWLRPLLWWLREARLSILIGLVVGAAIVVAAFLGLLTPIQERVAASYPSGPSAGRGRPDAPIQPMPPSGVYRNSTDAPLEAPLRITTPAGEDAYFVKLVDAETGAEIMTLFLRGGRSFETHVPLGRMRIRYATGREWRGEEALFGPDTAFSEADREFDFIQEADGIRGYTVELIRQPGGNLQTRRIAPTAF